MIKPPIYEQIQKDEFLEAFVMSDRKFFKGIQTKYLEHPFAKIDTTKYLRKSKTYRENFHFYDLVLNYNTSWSTWPKRRHSIIGTSSIETAGCYGDNIYVVIPLEAEIVLCPSDDIMTSFDGKLNEPLITSSLPYALQFNHELRDFFRGIGFSDPDIFGLTYTDVLKYLREYINSESVINSVTIEKLRTSKGDPDEFLGSIFSPILNGFQKGNLSINLFKDGPGQEIFGSGTFLLCLYEEMKKFNMISL